MILAGRIVRGGRADPGWIELAGTRIAATGAGAPPRAPDLTHEGLIAPGLVDIQVNGGAGVETVGGGAALDAIDARQLRHGVTSYLPTIITTDPETARRAVSELAERAADAGSPVAGIHLEGPFLSPQHHGVHRRELLCAPADGVPDYYEHPAVRLVTLAPELPGALELIERLVARGVTVSLGHSGADEATAAAAAERGATLVTHVFNAMAPLHHRAPGLVGFALVDERIGVGVIPDGLHVAPAALALVRRAAGERVILVSDAGVAAGAAPGEYRQAGLAVRLTEYGTLVGPDGTLAGSAIALDEGVRRWVSFTGASLEEALQAASTRPAAAVGLPNGLDTGAPADLVLLDDAGHVERVLRGGLPLP